MTRPTLLFIQRLETHVTENITTELKKAMRYNSHALYFLPGEELSCIPQFIAIQIYDPTYFQK
jgi:hypothetical protein